MKNIKRLFKKFIIITKTYKFKSNFVLLGITLLFAILIGRLIYIMVYKSGEYSTLAENQWKNVIEVPAERGKIFDRNGAILATTLNVYRIDLDLTSVNRYIKNEGLSHEIISEQISQASGIDYTKVYEKITMKNEDGTNANFATLARGVEKSIVDSVKALEIYGVMISSDTKRFYPNNNLLSQTLGIVNYDGVGSLGLELYYNNYLAGKNGSQILGTDANRDILPFARSQIVAAEPGKNITLTIDENIQYYAEKVAEKGLLEHKAKRVSVMVTDPNTGEILALANKPDFNLNTPYEGYDSFTGETEDDKIQSMWRNNVVSDIYEPGSTFKVLSMAAAIEEGVVHENDTFNCTGGIRFGDIYVKCWNTGGHGIQNLSDILVNSCNVGFMELGYKLGAEKLHEYIAKFGFGDYTNIDLPGEAIGIVKEVENISEIDLGTIAFGQTNSVTIPQLMMAFNAVVNGGRLIEPKIVSEITHTDELGNTLVDLVETKESKQVLSEATTSIMKRYLEDTALQGKEKNTFLEGHTIGIKTGTAEKIDPATGTYSTTKYVASMVGMYPVEEPKISIFIGVDEPSTGVYYGGQVATPLSKILFADLISYLDSGILQNNSISGNNVLLPEVRGLNKNEAKKILEQYGLNVNFTGNGDIVKEISPIPGTTLKEGSTIEADVSITRKISNKIYMPSLIGLNESEVSEILTTIDCKYKIKGKGKVIYQDAEVGEEVNKENILLIVFDEE